MAVNSQHSSNSTAGTDRGHVLYGADDRRCRHCDEVALAFDPDAGRPRCRSCDELA